jgi:hypothetical protein
MNRVTQEELALWPRPRWPSSTYLSDVFCLYLGVAILGAVLFFIGVVLIARPLWVVIFVAGIIAGVIGFRWGGRAIHRLRRIMETSVHHA